MRVLYIILGHENSDSLFEMAAAISTAATNSDVTIHFDAAASRADIKRLRLLVADQERITLVRDPVRCRWGTFSLVEATLRSLKHAVRKSSVYDYVVLLSGACRPTRPIAELENFLKDHRGMEFIESRDESWIVHGLKHERYQLYFPFGASRNYKYYLQLWTKFQKIIKMKRVPPNNLSVKFGSQWWALTWDTCIKILKYTDMHRNTVKFFKRTYIPDEMFFQTLVHRVADSSKISGKNLTFYEFDSAGKPRVFGNDHALDGYQNEKFFFRKIGTASSALHKRSLKVALRRTYEHKIIANELARSQITTKDSKSLGGELFSRDQFSDHVSSVLDKNLIPYVLIIASVSQIRSLSSQMDDDMFVSIGRLMSNVEVFQDAQINELKGLKKHDLAIRDLHPAHYLCRALSRNERVSIVFWCIEDNIKILPEMLCDKNALTISFYELEEFTYILPSCRFIEPCISINNGAVVFHHNCKAFLEYEWFSPLIKKLNNITL